MKNYRNVLIFGYSKSGRAVEKILISHNVEYKIFDDNMRLGGGKYIFKLTKKEIAKFDLIIISPAIPWVRRSRPEVRDAGRSVTALWQSVH